MMLLRAAALCGLFLLTLVSGPVRADLPPLPTLKSPVELDRYLGDWYVVANIPIGIPFFSDKNAVNYKESYELNDDGTIKLLCEFLDPKTGNQRSFEFKGFLTDDPKLATWKIQFVWPVRATYQIIYLDDEYSTTIVATPNRRYAWIMSRANQIADDELMELIDILADAGYNPNDVRRVPHDYSPQNDRATAMEGRLGVGPGRQASLPEYRQFLPNYRTLTPSPIDPPSLVTTRPVAG